MKKGQVTVFIILGIILLMMTALFIFGRSQVQEFQPEEIHPERKSPIQSYVDNCVEDVGAEAVLQIALRGGYFTMSDRMFYDPTASISFGFGTGVKVPLWQHRGELRIPSLHNMQIDLSIYVQDNIDTCLRGMEPFLEEYEVEMGEPYVETIIAEEDVAFSMAYPITLKARAREETLHYDSFSARADGRLMRVWNMANDILAGENEKAILEGFTMERISIDPEIPLNGMKFQCGRTSWFEPTLKQRLQDSIAIQLPGVRVRNTRHPPFLETEDKYKEWMGIDLSDFAVGNMPSGSPPEDMWEYSQMYWNFTDEDYSDLSIGFLYLPEWGMIFNANPSDGPFMRSARQELRQEFLNLLCMQVFHFTYDVYYPIMVTIRDDESFGGSGMVFRFGMPVILMGNLPDREAIPVPEDYDIGTNQEFCGAGRPQSTRLYAEDIFTGGELYGVNLSYRCYSFQCELGRTGLEGGEYRLTTKLPSSCYGGLIIAEKDGYMTSETQYDEQDWMAVQLYPTKKFDVEVRKLEIPEFWGEEELESSEIAVFQFEQNESGYMGMYKYPVDDPSFEQLELILGPAEYTVYFMMIKDGVMNGGYIGSFRTTYDEMKDADTIVLKMAFEEPTPNTPEEQVELFTYLYVNKTYLVDLRPEFK